MQPQSTQDYKQLLTEVIKKQIVILGPDITLSKARTVKGLTVQDDGTVTEVAGSAQEVTQALIDQFVELSGLIVKKTMEPLLLLNQSLAPAAPTPLPIPRATVPQQQAQPAIQPTQTTATQPLGVAPAAQPQQQSDTVPVPAANPLAA